MFDDGRSQSVIFVAHCVLNQNAVSDGTASYPGPIKEILELLHSSDVGIIQMPCPELHCLGLDRGNALGGSTPVIQENTRIRKILSQSLHSERIKQLAQSIVSQILEYRKHGFEIKGVIGVNRSPSCGVNSTSKDNQEVDGKGVFMEALHKTLQSYGMDVNMVGIKAFEIDRAVRTVKELLT
jgi:predicted secreted protein